MKKRGIFLLVCLLLATGGLGVRIYGLTTNMTVATMQSGPKYERTVGLKEARGSIYDCNREALTANKALYLTVIEPQYFQSAEKKEELEEHIGEISAYDEEMKKKVPFAVEVPYKIEGVQGITQKEIPGRYGKNLEAIHTLGYTDKKGTMGLSGIEGLFDMFLKSEEKIKVRYQSDAAGHTMGNEPLQFVEAKEEEVKKGVVLSIDKTIQEKVTKVVRETMDTGCAIVIDVKSGDIKAIESMPFVNPNDVGSLLKSKNGEFINRAYEAYTLGSIFKIVVLAAALENGIGSEQDEYTCVGSIEIGEVSIACNNKQGHGRINMMQAFGVSCNPYFIQLTQKIGKETLVEYMKKFGLGEKMVLNGMIATSGGNVPALEDIPPAELANLAIGQGKLMVTPLQVANMFATIARGGTLREVNLVLSKVGGDGEIMEDYKNVQEEIVVSWETADRIKNMLRYVVTDGTGKKADIEGLSICGKTSSAQWVGDKVHGWFGGFYPMEQPKYAIVVFCENGGGGSAALPIFRSIVQEIG